jgi:hypothetical protein
MVKWNVVVEGEMKGRKKGRKKKKDQKKGKAPGGIRTRDHSVKSRAL